MTLKTPAHEAFLTTEEVWDTPRRDAQALEAAATALGAPAA